MREFLLGHRRQFALFVAGGLLSAVADIGAMQLLIARGIHYSLATSAGFALGLLVNYAFHAKLTFAGASGNTRTFLRYLCVVGLNYAVTMASVALSVELAGQALPGKIVALPLVALNGFILSKYWIFR
ncbi:GtrA family protein [Pseudoduganella sp. GCM10020061]|jgi:putative flippase GtrA|uniref:GtrA family protein n=1 Tax=Pseudoduganella sp. GCM10020061 TaxID=3317345 RepID=UPI003629C502